MGTQHGRGSAVKRRRVSMMHTDKKQQSSPPWGIGTTTSSTFFNAQSFPALPTKTESLLDTTHLGQEMLNHPALTPKPGPSRYAQRKSIVVKDLTLDNLPRSLVSAHAHIGRDVSRHPALAPNPALMDSVAAELPTDVGYENLTSNLADLHVDSARSWATPSSESSESESSSGTESPQLRAKQWSHLDIKAIRKSVKEEKHVKKHLMQPTLVDAEKLDSEGARRAADALVPVELKLKRKMKGKRGNGKGWYSLTPFVNTH